MTIENTGDLLVCQTRDISRQGCFLDTAEDLADGLAVSVVILDSDTGEAVEAKGTITRTLVPSSAEDRRGMGVYFTDPPEGWLLMFARHQRQRTGPGALRTGPQVRLRVVVIGDATQRRSALALYVTSGWDVRFASDLSGMHEALADSRVDAVIAEHDLNDGRWRDVLMAARSAQPSTRRIVRSSLRGRMAPPAGDAHALVHQVVDQDGGLDTLLDALTADFGIVGSSPRQRQDSTG